MNIAIKAKRRPIWTRARAHYSICRTYMNPFDSIRYALALAFAGTGRRMAERSLFALAFVLGILSNMVIAAKRVAIRAGSAVWAFICSPPCTFMFAGADVFFAHQALFDGRTFAACVWLAIAAALVWSASYIERRRRRDAIVAAMRGAADRVRADVNAACKEPLAFAIADICARKINAAADQVKP